MAYTNRSAASDELGPRLLALALAGAGLVGPLHANPDVVEGVSVSGSEAARVDLGYRCEGQDCGFEAVLHGVVAEDVTEYEWRFGNGETVTTTAPVIEHRWTEPGTQSVTLRVHDRYCDPLTVASTLSILASAPEPDPAADIAPLTRSSVRLAQDPMRKVSEPLHGTTVDGDAFVFLSAPEVAESATFRLSGPSLDAAILRIDDGAPFDLMGGSPDSARSFDTRELADGGYRLDVSVIYPGGREDALGVTFEVRNGIVEPVAEAPTGELPDGTPAGGGDTPSGTGSERPMGSASPEQPAEEAPDATPVVGDGETESEDDEPPTGAAMPDESGPFVVEPAGTLVFSKRADRSGDKPLAGAVLRGRIFARLEGAENARSVRFFLDDPTLSGEPLRIDNRAPWDAAGGGKRRARPIRTGRLDQGRHVLSAEVFESGSSYVVHASFTVRRRR